MSPLISGRLFCNVNNPIFYFLIWGMLFPIECPSHTDGKLAVSTISSPCFHHSLSLKESYILSKWNLCFQSGKSSPNHPHSFHPLIQLSGTCCGCFCFEQDFELALECAQVAAGWVLWCGRSPCELGNPSGLLWRRGIGQCSTPQLSMSATARLYFFWIPPDPGKITSEKNLYRSVLLFLTGELPLTSTEFCLYKPS